MHAEVCNNKLTTPTAIYLFQKPNFIHTTQTSTQWKNVLLFGVNSHKAYNKFLTTKMLTEFTDYYQLCLLQTQEHNAECIQDIPYMA